MHAGQIGLVMTFISFVTITGSVRELGLSVLGKKNVPTSAARWQLKAPWLSRNCSGSDANRSCFPLSDVAGRCVHSFFYHPRVHHWLTARKKFVMVRLVFATH